VALLLDSLRQHEPTAADSSNIQLQKEIGERRPRELDAVALTSEVSHRIKNNLQIVAMFVRPLGGTSVAPGSEGARTAVRIRFPSRLRRSLQ
jgi:hypothetical protein